MDSATTRIEIFRVGRHTDVNGTVVDFSEANARQLVDVYDSSLFEAPIVVGHPKLDAPAYGWVKGLALDGDTIVAEVGEIEPAFAELRRAGRFKKVSAELYPPGHSASPAPNAWYLKHVGFLGAAAPAVKGLKTASFAEAEGLVTLEMGADPDRRPASFGAPEPAREISQNQETKMSEEDKTAAFAERETALNTREQELQERERKFAESQAKIRHEANVSFAEGQVKAGNLAPGGKDLVVGILDELDGAKTVKFGEAGELTPAAAFRKLFDHAAPIVSFGEAAPADKKADVKTVSFAAPDGFKVDPKSAEIHQRAVQLQADNPKLSYNEAVDRAALA